MTGHQGFQVAGLEKIWAGVGGTWRQTNLASTNQLKPIENNRVVSFSAWTCLIGWLFISHLQARCSLRWDDADLMGWRTYVKREEKTVTKFLRGLPTAMRDAFANYSIVIIVMMMRMRSTTRFATQYTRPPATHAGDGTSSRMQHGGRIHSQWLPFSIRFCAGMWRALLGLNDDFVGVLFWRKCKGTVDRQAIGCIFTILLDNSVQFVKTIPNEGNLSTLTRYYIP